MKSIRKPRAKNTPGKRYLLPLFKKFSRIEVKWGIDMEPISRGELQKLIQEAEVEIEQAEKAQQDTKKLRQRLERVKNLEQSIRSDERIEPPKGGIKIVKEEAGKQWIIASTGPIKEEDFEE
jgi:hypothetical protein